jgi:hypothetical protein
MYLNFSKDRLHDHGAQTPFMHMMSWTTSMFTIRRLLDWRTSRLLFSQHMELWTYIFWFSKRVDVFWFKMRRKSFPCGAVVHRRWHHKRWSHAIVFSRGQTGWVAGRTISQDQPTSVFFRKNVTRKNISNSCVKFWCCKSILQRAPFVFCAWGYILLQQKL